MGADYKKCHRSVIGGMTATAIAAGLTRYQMVFGGPQMANLLDAQMRMPFPCHITNLNVRSQVPPGVGETYDYAIFVNGIITALTLQIAGAVDVAAGPDADIVGIAAQDEIQIRIVTSGAAANSQHIWSFEVRH